MLIPRPSKQFFADIVNNFDNLSIQQLRALEDFQYDYLYRQHTDDPITEEQQFLSYAFLGWYIYNQLNL